MVKLKSYEIAHRINYKLDNGVCLFADDWNGNQYRPVYNGKYAIIGFEEE